MSHLRRHNDFEFKAYTSESYTYNKRWERFSVDNKETIHYPEHMSEITPVSMDDNAGQASWLRSRPLRFVLALFFGFIMTLITILFMRYLIMGYDKTAGDAMTRYLGFRTSFSFSQSDDSIKKPGERPGIQPEVFYEIEEENISEKDVLLLQPTAQDGISFQEELKTSPELPRLATEEISMQEQMKQIKETILTDGE